VLVTDDTVKGKRTETIMRYGAVTDEMINNPSIMVLGVLTPDVLYSDDLMLLSMIAWMKMRWLKLQMPEGKLRCFKWYYDDNFLGRILI
jgi:hypothetical protein